jgi:hypothetical protein
LGYLDDVLNRALLLLPAGCIRERFCDRTLWQIERIGKTERHEIAGKNQLGFPLGITPEAAFAAPLTECYETW